MTASASSLVLTAVMWATAEADGNALEARVAERDGEAVALMHAGVGASGTVDGGERGERWVQCHGEGRTSSELAKPKPTH